MRTILFLAVCVAAFGGISFAEEESTPETVWTTLKKAYIAKEFDKVYACYSDKFRAGTTFEEFKKRLELHYDKKVERFRGLEFAGGEEYLENGVRYFKFKLKSGDKTSEAGVMVFENDRWRIHEFR